MDAARALIGLHSTDAASVYLSARTRVDGFRVTDLETALYEARSLVRLLGMRRTMFIFPVELAATVHAACTRGLAKGERKRTVQMIEGAGLAKDGGRWLAKVESQTLDLLRQKREATAVELSKEISGLRKKIPVGAGKKWEGTIGVSTRVLFLLANEGRIVRTRPLGSWLSTQYRWAPLETWLGTDIDVLPTETAQTELARLWLQSFGPASFNDLKWWTGWTVADTRKALTGAGALEVDMDGVTGYLLPDDTDQVRASRPAAALLPALDPTTMGWFERDWYLGPHRPFLFDRNGNAGPTVWWDGRIVGGWAQRGDGEIALRVLEDIGRSAVAEVEAEADALRSWLGDVRVIPRFRTPLEKELTG